MHHINVCSNDLRWGFSQYSPNMSTKLSSLFFIPVRSFRPYKCISRANPRLSGPRSFSYTTRYALANPSSSPLSDLKVNQDRLWNDIHHTCQWGKGERWGEYVSHFCFLLQQMSTSHTKAATCSPVCISVLWTR